MQTVRNKVKRAQHIKRTLGAYVAARYLAKRGVSPRLIHVVCWATGEFHPQTER